jgi:hypothetical protein
MRDESESVKEFSPAVSAFQFQQPAIRITERIGESEIVYEYATLEDYKGWREIEDASKGDKVNIQVVRM